MKTATLLNKVNDFARENNCKCTVVVFEKGHEEDLPEKLFRMFTENGAQIFKISTDTKGRTINAGGSSVGKARKTAAIKARTASVRSKAKKTLLAVRKSGEWKQNAADLLNVLQARLAGLQATE